MLRQATRANSHVFISPLATLKSNCLSNATKQDKAEQSEEDLEASLPIFKRGEVDSILNDYQKEYALNQDVPIVASTQGKPPFITANYPSRHQLYAESNIKPRSTAQFRVKDLTLDEVILVLIHPDSNLFPMNVRELLPAWILAITNYCLMQMNFVSLIFHR